MPSRVFILSMLMRQDSKTSKTHCKRVCDVTWKRCMAHCCGWRLHSSGLQDPHLNRADFDRLRNERSGAKINTRITQTQPGTVGSSRRRLIFCRCEQKGTREPATFQREEAACEAKERATSCTHYSTDRPVLLRYQRRRNTCYPTHNNAGGSDNKHYTKRSRKTTQRQNTKSR